MSEREPEANRSFNLKLQELRKMRHFNFMPRGNETASSLKHFTFNLQGVRVQIVDVEVWFATEEHIAWLYRHEVGRDSLVSAMRERGFAVDDKFADELIDKLEKRKNVVSQ